MIASTNDQVHTKSLPSTELTGAKTGEYVAGAGVLPGSPADSGVAQLPDERNTSREVPTAAGAAATVPDTAQSTAQGVKERLVQFGESLIIVVFDTVILLTLPS